MKPTLAIKMIATLLSGIPICLAGPEALGAGIPHPGITLYGVILDETGAERLTSGPLEFTYTPSGGGNTVTVSTSLADLDGGFSYVLTIPVEEAIGEFTVSPNTIGLPADSVTYNRSAKIGQVDLEIDPGSISTTLDPDQHRGVIQRLDMKATGPTLATEDLNRDGFVNGRDIMFWFQYWMRPGPTIYDFDRSGRIDGRDLLHMIQSTRPGPGMGGAANVKAEDPGRFR